MSPVLQIALGCLIALLVACVPAGGVYKVSQRSDFVGVAVSADTLLTVLHPPHEGQQVWVWVRWRWVPAVVASVGERGLVVLRGDGEQLGLERGDSGSPVIDGAGEIVAAIIGRGARE